MTWTGPKIKNHKKDKEVQSVEYRKCLYIKQKLWGKWEAVYIFLCKPILSLNQNILLLIAQI